MSVETYRVVGAARLSEIVARERAKDPDGMISIEDLGNSEYRIEVEASADKDGVEVKT